MYYFITRNWKEIKNLWRQSSLTSSWNSHEKKERQKTEHIFQPPKTVFEPHTESQKSPFRPSKIRSTTKVIIERSKENKSFLPRSAPAPTSVWAELVIISAYPATHPPPRKVWNSNSRAKCIKDKLLHYMRRQQKLFWILLPHLH